jgi:hypothetical protein
VILPHALIVHPSELTTDGDGNPVRVPARVGVPAAGYVQPVTSTEDTAAGQASESRHVAYLDPDTPRLDAFSRVLVDGLAYETVGEALWFANPEATVTYWRVTLRKVGG